MEEETMKLCMKERQWYWSPPSPKKKKKIKLLIFLMLFMFCWFVLFCWEREMGERFQLLFQKTFSQNFFFFSKTFFPVFFGHISGIIYWPPIPNCFHLFFSLYSWLYFRNNLLASFTDFFPLFFGYISGIIYWPPFSHFFFLLNVFFSL